ncbi:hypothetical protein [Streptomyces sp. NRRL B-24484]|uniref:hypothetical protein n=1 Tax=Streptomyces sp. NRRL B-24484 TaxID=1463833 RepID=UPI001F26D0BA|nr:hypothetical protein [Streptomyces sp. NRRL B-24484]
MTPPPGQGALDQLIRAQAGHPQSDATAYLRAAAHLDRGFRHAVIEELAENPHRIPPPSFGIDLVAVLNECFAARRWELQRGAVMLLLPLAAMPIHLAGALLPLVLTLTARWYLFLAGAASRYLERWAVRLAGPGVRGIVRLITGLWWIVTLVYLAVTVSGAVFALLDLSFAESLERDCGYYSSGGYGCDSGAASAAPLWAALLVVVGWMVVAAVDRHRTLRRLHLLGTGRAPVEPDRDAALCAELRRKQADPEVVYSDFAPFVGAGVELDHWSFAVELVPDDAAHLPDGTPDLSKEAAPALTVLAVHAHLRRELQRLAETGTPGYPGDRMHTLRVIDHVFKNGRRLGPATDWSGTGPGSAFAVMAPYAAREAAARAGRGAADVPDTWWVDSLDLAAEERLRHYLAVRVTGWNDEVALTVFTRVQLQGGLLFLEARAFLLPPIARAYHAIDTASAPNDLVTWTALALRSTVSAFVLTGRAVPDLGRALRSSWRRAGTEAWYRWMCHENRLVDHAPACSVRELGAESEYQQLFQEMDVQRFLKSISTRTLTAVHGALREHGYLTDQYDSLRTVVINNGVQVNGAVTGTIQTGEGSRAEFRQVTTPATHLGTRKN